MRREQEMLGRMINLITLSRLPCTIVFLFFTRIYLMEAKKVFGFYAIIVSLIIILSDYVDGKLARKNHSVSKLGQSLDIYSDFIYILSALILFNIYRIIPIYFTCIVIYKFIEFLLISKIVKRKTIGKKDDKYYYDKLGSIVSSVYYVIPTVQILFLILELDTTYFIMHNILRLVSMMTFIASFLKLKCSVRKY